MSKFPREAEKTAAGVSGQWRQILDHGIQDAVLAFQVDGFRPAVGPLKFEGDGAVVVQSGQPDPAHFLAAGQQIPLPHHLTELPHPGRCVMRELDQKLIHAHGQSVPRQALPVSGMKDDLAQVVYLDRTGKIQGLRAVGQRFSGGKKAVIPVTVRQGL